MNTYKYNDRFERNIGVVTKAEQEKLKNSKVAIAGAGGVGGNVLNMLVRAGVEKFSIADFDTFSASNINRQHGALTENIGKSKVKVLSSFAKSVNNEIVINQFEEGLTVDNIEEFLDDVDIVIDAIDFLSPNIRRKLIDTAQARGLYVFLAPALGFGASVATFSPKGPSYDEFFGVMPKKITPELTYEFGRKIFPYIPPYVDMEAYIRGLNDGNLPTFAPAVMLASTFVACDAILLLTNRRKPICIPQIFWADMFEKEMKVINV